jgi:hypothetical protein
VDDQLWKGPDVLVVGWTPFHLNPPLVPAYTQGLATTLLFQSGNPAPPIAFRGYPGFANWLHPKFLVGSKEYRAALYLEGVAAKFPDDGSPPQADCTSYGSFPGYTPYRIFAGGVNRAALIPSLPQYGAGHGPLFSPTPVPDPAGDWVELRYRAEFKLSGLPNLLSRVLTNAWAPYAWCEIVYRFDKSGQITVRVDGSAIPSRCLYIDWVIQRANSGLGIVPEYDMLTANRANVTGFLQTIGWGCQPAPIAPASRLRWSGQAIAW